MRRELIILTPTDQQILNCASMGWTHVGDGLFEHTDSGLMGYFTPEGFRKE